MRPSDKILYKALHIKLESYNNPSLAGIQNANQKHCFILQLIDSIRRVKYVTTIRDKDISPLCCDPTSIAFDPLKAASWHKKNGNIDEAFWLVFLATHFGKNKKSKWELVKNTYGALGDNEYWTWHKTSSDTDSFRTWLYDNLETLRETGSVGNHRKYQSLDPYKPTGTGAAVGSYVDWILAAGNHMALINEVAAYCEDNPNKMFDYLYNDMGKVISFGRMAKFDYLTMVGKLGLAQIEPASAYMIGATGPVPGGKLLFFGDTEAAVTAKELDELVKNLSEYLNIYFGMQVLEDALCNWQKSPQTYLYFSG